MIQNLMEQGQNFEALRTRGEGHGEAWFLVLRPLEVEKAHRELKSRFHSVLHLLELHITGVQRGPKVLLRRLALFQGGLKRPMGVYEVRGQFREGAREPEVGYLEGNGGRLTSHGGRQQY